MIFTFLPLLAVSLSLVDLANAHGFVEEVTVGGKIFQGWHPFDDPYKSPQPDVITRHVPNDGPITDVNDPNLACHVGGDQGTKLVADAPAGSSITFHWNQWLADHIGPVSTYMASCNGDCTTFNTAGAQWFKIDAAGYDPNTKQWASSQLIANGNSWTSTIPSSLEPGQYLVRHEPIALHSSSQPQYYPSCTQIRVTGNGNQRPPASALVSIPGIYNGVQFPDIWADGFQGFTMPGPAVFTGDDGNNGDDHNTPPPPPPVSNAPLPPPLSTSSPYVPAPSPTSPTGRCRKNVRRSNKMAKRHASLAKRHH